MDNTGQYHVLNVGSGPRLNGKLHRAFRSTHWREIRLDIDPSVEPDVTSSVTDLGAFADARLDAIWSSHNLEHLHFHEVPQALREFVRVLRPGGFALVTCPDLAAVAQVLVEHGPDTGVYQSPAGPIAAFDMLFGHRASIQAGNGFMAHHSGFTQDSIASEMLAAGFAEVRVSPGRFYDLWALALMDEDSLDLARTWLAPTEQAYLLDDGVASASPTA